MDISNLFDRHVPLAIATALVMQAGTAVWWAASKDGEDQFQERRIAVLERAAVRTADSQTQMVERLARIEERVNAGAGVLDRIEKHMGAWRE